MINQELVSKYQTALDIANSNDKLRRYTQLIRETLYKLLQPNYVATIDEVVWAECFIKQREKIDENKEDFRIMMLKEFSQTDWCGYTGAERFKDGSEPLIATRDLGNLGVTIVVDNQGIEVYLYTHDVDNTQVWSVYKEDYKRFKIVVSEEICRVVDSVEDESLLKETLENQLGMEFEYQ